MRLPFELPEGYEAVQAERCPICNRPKDFVGIRNSKDRRGFGLVDGFIFAPHPKGWPLTAGPELELEEDLRACGIRMGENVGTEPCAKLNRPGHFLHGREMVHSFWTREVLGA
ncbi:MAG: hypothetical protein V3V32_04650 [Dehalococcoidia bacterium]